MKNASFTRRSWGRFAGCGDRDHPPSGAEDVPRPSEGLAADRVEDHVDVSRRVFESLGAVVDDGIGTQAADELQVVRRCGRDHVGAAPVCELDGEKTDPARRPVDQHALARREADALDQPCQAVRAEMGVAAERTWSTGRGSPARVVHVGGRESSVGVTAAAWTRTSTSSAPGCGVGAPRS
jgi:hypothetical protein